MAYTFAHTKVPGIAWIGRIFTQNHTEIRPAEHGGLEINFDFSGGLRNEIGGKEVDFLPGELVAFNPRVPHTEIHRDTNFSDSFIVLEDRFIEELLGKKSTAESILEKPQAFTNFHIVRLAREILRISHLTFVPKLHLKQLCEELALSLFSAAPEIQSSIQDSYHPSLVRRAKRRLIDSIDNPEMDLDTLAAEFGMSKYHFLRTFKNTAGISPIKYLRNLRIETFAQRIAEEKGEVTDLALASGFSSLSSFYDAFTSTMGVSPKAFARTVAQSPQEIERQTYAYMKVKI